MRWLALLLALTACAPRTYPEPLVTITDFRSAKDQVDADWSPDGRTIAYTLRGPDSYLDIHLATHDGTHLQNLTATTPGLPTRHVGGPAWHPSGKYLAVVVEKQEHSGSSFEALPGFAGYSDFWLITADGRAAYPLTNLPNDRDHGVLFGDFSPDGNQLVWAERIAAPNPLVSTMGTTVIKLADFVQTPQPHLENIRILAPGGKTFHETYGFSPDGSRIIFCSQMGHATMWDQNIYTMNLQGGDIRALTTENYNEHATYTPDGKSIVWMTNAQSSGGTDWWIMDASGANKRRLTYMNEPGHSHYAGESVWAGLAHFSLDGTSFIGGVQTSLLKQIGKIVIVRFNAAQAKNQW